jgi:hypothetical protein
VADVKIDYVKGSNIIALEPRRMEDVFPAVSEVEAYWTALAQDQPVPARGRIDPRGIESALSHAFILERVAPTVARFRLAGSHLADLMGMEVRGMPLTAMFLPEARGIAGEALDHAFSAPAKVTLTLAGERGVGRAPLDARMILLPLRDEEGRITRVLGALEAKGAIGRQPRRFSILSSRHVDIGEAVIDPATGRPRRTPGMAEAPAGFGWRRPDGRPALHLVQGGD